MELSGCNIKKFLRFSQKKKKKMLFLYFGKQKPSKNSLYFGKQLSKLVK